MALLRTFSVALAWRIVMLGVAIATSVTMATLKEPQIALAVLFGIVAISVAFSLFRYVNDTNRRLARFFESVRYSDFAIRFSSAKDKGDSFAEVNRQFNEVLEAFRQTRAEKEANLLFLNTIVQHLSAGILVFDAQSGVLVSNSAAFQLLGVYRLHHLHDLPERHKALTQFVQNLTSKGKMLYQPETNRQLAVQGVSVSLQGRAVRLLTLQNIHPELQRKEVDAWRNLTRVLRHEIMNSVTPIVSLVETAQEIVKHDLPQNAATADLTEALEVVAVRSRGLVNFVEAYRSFSAIPQPKLEDISAKALLERVVQLAVSESKYLNIKVESFVQPEHLRLHADAGQLEMVLINLVKNAREAIESLGFRVEGLAPDAKPSTLNPQHLNPQPLNPQPLNRITLRAGADAKGHPFIEVEDNGPGIPTELLDEIFIPFFTTKPTGTGVGLSISKQIMQLHGGDIRVSTSTGGGARFVLEF
ncbi:MAG: histidine kinase [Phycisphaerae bacterium]|nr:histidine kinase [Saprospiraceae bacterium]